MAPAVDWARGLLPELVVSILERLEAFDQVRFACVCTRWYSIAHQANLRRLPALPWVMLPPVRDDGDDRSGTCTFVGIPTPGDGDRNIRGPHRVSLPEFIWRRCVGSSPDGWLVVLGKNMELCVVNPLTRARLHLPPVATIPEIATKGNTCRSPKDYNIFVYHYFKKAIMFELPHHGLMVALLVESPEYGLAFARVGDVAWAAVATPIPSHRPHDYIDDIAFHQCGKIYGITDGGQVMGCDLSVFPSNPMVVTFYHLQDRPPNVVHQHLVSFLPSPPSTPSASCSLLVVYRLRRPANDNTPPTRPTMLAVKLEQASPSAFRCFDVADLGGHTVFLDDWCCNVAIPRRGFPGLRENCIYHTRVSENVCRLDVVDLAGQVVGSHHLCHSQGMYYPPSIWFCPVLQF